MRERVIMNALCSVFALGALAVAVWILATGQLQQQGVDGLFLLVLSLTVAFSFSLIPLQFLRRRLAMKRGSAASAAAGKRGQARTAAAEASGTMQAGQSGDHVA